MNDENHCHHMQQQQYQNSAISYSVNHRFSCLRSFSNRLQTFVVKTQFSCEEQIRTSAENKSLFFALKFPRIKVTNLKQFPQQPLILWPFSFSTTLRGKTSKCMSLLFGKLLIKWKCQCNWHFDKYRHFYAPFEKWVRAPIK